MYPRVTVPPILQVASGWLTIWSLANVVRKVLKKKAEKDEWVQSQEAQEVAEEDEAAAGKPEMLGGSELGPPQGAKAESNGRQGLGPPGTTPLRRWQVRRRLHCTLPCAKGEGVHGGRSIVVRALSTSCEKKVGWKRHDNRSRLSLS